MPKILNKSSILAEQGNRSTRSLLKSGDLLVERRWIQVTVYILAIKRCFGGVQVGFTVDRRYGLGRLSYVCGAGRRRIIAALFQFITDEGYDRDHQHQE